jgi:membrane peptidoglycan carboxypeptidase
MGSIVVAGRLIHDHLPFGVLSLTEVLEKSSDVGTIKVAERLGPDKFYQTIRDFGFGTLTGIELPGEQHGLLRPPQNWGPSSIGSVAMGQEVSATPVQIISAISALANGGTYYPPKIVEKVEGGFGGELPVRAQPHQATDEKTAATLREMMESVILKGTGKPAKLDGWTAAGKSGTAQEIDTNTGRYSPTAYVASFVGFAPVNSPAITVLVMFDTPQGEHMGGNVGGPIFKRVTEQALAYLSVPHDIPGVSDEEQASNGKKNGDSHATDAADSAEEARYQAAVAKSSNSSGTNAAVEGIEVPNFTGQPVRNVIEECSRLGITPTLIGNGIAVEQSPDAGTVVPHGSGVTVRFGRAAKLVPASAVRAAH